MDESGNLKRKLGALKIHCVAVADLQVFSLCEVIVKPHFSRGVAVKVSTLNNIGFTDFIAVKAVKV